MTLYIRLTIASNSYV